MIETSGEVNRPQYALWDRTVATKDLSTSRTVGMTCFLQQQDTDLVCRAAHHVWKLFTNSLPRDSSFLSRVCRTMMASSPTLEHNDAKPSRIWHRHLYESGATTAS